MASVLELMKDDVFISCFSVAMTKYHDRGNYGQKSLFGLVVAKG